MSRHTVATEHGTVEVRKRESKHTDVDGWEVWRGDRFVGLVVPHRGRWEAAVTGVSGPYMDGPTTYPRRVDAVVFLAGVSRDWEER